MVSEACLPSNAYYPRTSDYTLYSEVHVCWFEHSDSSFVYGFMSLDYGFGTITTTTSLFIVCSLCYSLFALPLGDIDSLCPMIWAIPRHLLYYFFDCQIHLDH